MVTKNKKRNLKMIKIGYLQQCIHCNKKLTIADMTLEHICPKACRGKDEQQNFSISCAKCNNERLNQCHQNCKLGYPNTKWNNILNKHTGNKEFNICWFKN